VREGARQLSIESHLAPRLAAATAAKRQSSGVILDLEAVDVSPSLQSADGAPSGFQVLAAYLRHDLSTPLRQPQATAPVVSSAAVGSGRASMPADSPRFTWDDQVLPDRLGSFINRYA
jgi:hypothetical protein